MEINIPKKYNFVSGRADNYLPKKIFARKLFRGKKNSHQNRILFSGWRVNNCQTILLANGPRIFKNNYKKQFSKKQFFIVDIGSHYLFKNILLNS